MNISPKSHVYRLCIVLAVCVMCFILIRSYAIPASWNYTVWYRGDNQEDLKQLPLLYGGNESCHTCHEEVSLVEAVTVKVKGEFADFEDELFEDDEESDIVMVFEHKTLSCESCHGPLVHHANEKDKIADAIVMDKSNWQCMNCHEKLISRPVDYPQFTEDIEKHQNLEEQTLCMKCHDPHNPIEDKIAMEVELDFGDEL